MSAALVNIRVTVTADERAEIAARAKTLHLSMSEYVRMRALADVREAGEVDRITERMDVLESAFASTLDAHRESLESDLDVQTERVKSALTAFAKFLNKWGKKRAADLDVTTAPAVTVGETPAAVDGDTGAAAPDQQHSNEGAK